MAVVAICCAVGVIDPAGPDPWVRSSMRLHDYLHVPAFVAIAAVLLAGFPVGPKDIRGRLWHYGVVLAACVGAGVLIELLQLARGGDADAGDVLRDVAGTVFTLLIAASSWTQIRATGRWSLRLAAIVVVVSVAWPTIAALNDEWHARRAFPVLADFSTSTQLDRFQWRAGTDFERVCERNADAACDARVTLSPGRYPGFTLRYFPRDWRGYQRLVIACVNPSPEPLTLNVRIDDRHHNQSYRDRFNGTYILAPGANAIRIPLADVEGAPRGRKLDLGNVRTVTVFAYQLRSPRELLIDIIRLEH